MCFFCLFLSVYLSVCQYLDLYIIYIHQEFFFSLLPPIYAVAVQSYGIKVKPVLGCAC